MVFQVNYLGHFLLTNLLLTPLKAAKSSRIVNVSSLLYKLGRISHTNLNAERKYSEFHAYSQTKLASNLFTRQLAKRLIGSNVVVNCLHPGAVKTDIFRNFNIFYSAVLFVAYIFFKDVKSGAQTTLAVALDPEFENISGQYFRDCKIEQFTKRALDDNEADWLWRTSEKLTNLIE